MIVRIPIGDWSSDGHGHVEHFYAEVSGTLETVSAAYFAAKKKYPALCPEAYCKDLEDRMVPAVVTKELEQMGFVLTEFEKEYDIQEDGAWEASPELIARLLVWFIRLGTPELAIELVELPSLIDMKKGKKSQQLQWGYGAFSI